MQDVMRDFGSRAQAQFFGHSKAIRLHAFDSDAEPIRHFFVRMTHRDELENLRFSRTQRRSYFGCRRRIDL